MPKISSGKVKRGARPGKRSFGVWKSKALKMRGKEVFVTATPSSTSQTLVKGIVERANGYGLIVAVGPNNKRYGFTLDKVKNYGGQSLEEAGLAIGSPVSMEINGRQVSSVDTPLLADYGNNRH